MIESQCPYCGEPVELTVDPSGASEERYVEDCAVCCRPWDVTVVRGDDDGEVYVTLERQDS